MSIRWIVVALVGVVVPVWAEPKPALDLDLTYAKVGEKEIKLDLARPEGKGPFPCVVLFHGGGWRMGNKKDVRSWLPFLAKEGYVAASVGYRLVPDATFPAQIEDGKSAVRFLRANADKYGIDKDRVAAMGWSAGGHLACMLGLTDPKCGFEGTDCSDQSSRVQAVVDYFGPTDLAAFGKDELAQKGMLAPFVGKRYADDPAAHEKASPVKYVSKDAPPFLIFHGTKDWVVPIEQSRELAGKLKEFRVPVKLVEVPGEGHGWEGKANEETTGETLKFLAERLKK
jgi:acetyl esterase/lipase